MEKMKSLILLYLSCLSACLIQAASANILLTVPFQNISLNSGQRIRADYSFGTHAIIFCFENTTSSLGRITWTFQGTSRRSNLPIFLKTKAPFEGEFADPNGLIRIFNNTNKTLSVSCLFGF